VRVLCEARPDLADQTRTQKEETDRLEVRIEQECVRVQAQYDPVAFDLRRMVAVLKINSDLERMADLARHIAKRARKLAREPDATPIPQPLADLAQTALDQVRGCVDALARYDLALAGTVIRREPEVDRQHRAVRKGLKQAIVQDPRRLDPFLRLIQVAGNLERVADHASNVAEMVVYLRKGEILRHGAGGTPDGA
jgi:phosphate transport system protein